VNTENVTKVHLTPGEQHALCLTACHLDGKEEGERLTALWDSTTCFALKDAILKLKGMTPPEPVRLTKGELEALASSVIWLDCQPRPERMAALGSFARFNPLREALGKIQMALYPEEGTPQ